ncbi:MAG: hypothetical protein HQK54_15710 [Oligoflexales bacterium]|nr:hypothetical protein [Oligoflexales bacterium]
MNMRNKTIHKICPAVAVIVIGCFAFSCKQETAKNSDGNTKKPTPSPTYNPDYDRTDNYGGTGSSNYGPDSTGGAGLNPDPCMNGGSYNNGTGSMYGNGTGSMYGNGTGSMYGNGTGSMYGNGSGGINSYLKLESMPINPNINGINGSNNWQYNNGLGNNMPYNNGINGNINSPYNNYNNNNPSMYNNYNSSNCVQNPGYGQNGMNNWGMQTFPVKTWKTFSGPAAVKDCIESWGPTNPFYNVSSMSFRILTPMRTMPDQPLTINDTYQSSTPELVLVRPGTASGPVVHRLMNPNGWYCVDTTSGGIANATFAVSPSAKISGGRQNVMTVPASSLPVSTAPVSPISSVPTTVNNPGNPVVTNSTITTSY